MEQNFLEYILCTFFLCTLEKIKGNFHIASPRQPLPIPGGNFWLRRTPLIIA